MELTAVEARVLGALIEKRMTTPDHYPLTTSSLVSACNQSSNRDPVVSFDEQTVLDAVNSLRDREMARTVKRAGERAMKHTESVAAALDLEEPHQVALLAVLLLRGPQTSGELRLRTERYCEFGSLEAVDAELRRMQSADIPTVVLLEREPGQKEPRWMHLLGGAVRDVATAPDPEVSPPDRVDELATEVADLRLQVERLKADVTELRALFD